MDWWYWSKGEYWDGTNMVYLSLDNYADTSSSSTSPKPYLLMPKNQNIRSSKKTTLKSQDSTVMSGRRLSASFMFSFQSSSNCQKTTWSMHTLMINRRMIISVTWYITSELETNGIGLRNFGGEAIPTSAVSLYSSHNMSLVCKSALLGESGSM